MHVATELLDQPVHDRHAQTRAAGAAPGREEGLEQPCLRQLVHADAGVANGQTNEGAGNGPSGGEPVRGLQVSRPKRQAELAALGHGVACVGGQVHHDLFDRPGAGEDLIEPVGRLDLDIDVLGQQAAQGRLEVGDQLPQVEWLDLELLAPTEGEELLDELLTAGDGRFQFFNVIGRLTVGLGQLIGEEFGVDLHHGQQVVEVVSHSACQLTHRLHLLGLAELLLQLHALGEVADRAQQSGLAFELDDPRRDLRGQDAAVAMDQAILRWALGAAPQE